MGNQPPPAKRREEDSAGSMDDDDKISQLPQPILHHILSHLPQKHAIQTCILSKSWRYLGPTLPKIEISESSFRSRQKFLSVVENTLQRYGDQNLSIQEFILEMLWPVNPETISFLNKWISIVVMNMGVKTLKLISASHFSLPSVVFEAQALEELFLKGCELDQINNCIFKLKLLKHLSLAFVCVEEETFEKIMSSCPLIEHLVFSYCCGLSSIKINKVPNLKHFECHMIHIKVPQDSIGSIEIDDAPSLETIRIKGEHWKLYHLHNNYFFPRLKSLYLMYVHLTTDSFDNFSSNNCPCLEELQLHYCPGFSEFELSNRSIKRLVINIYDRPIKAAIAAAANMVYFEFSLSGFLPSISFATTSSKCKSHIHVWRSSGSTADVSSKWCLELYEFLKSLSQSQISLEISYLPNLTDQDTYDDGGSSCEPVVVEHLFLSTNYSPYAEHLFLSTNCSSDALPTLLDRLFCICRPRYIGLTLSDTKIEKIYERQLAESIWKTLVNKGETRQCDLFWQQDLEETSIQVSEENTNEWHPFHVCEFSNNQSIRFMLKWRD